MLFGALNALGRQKGNDAPNTVSSINQFLGMALTTDGRLEEAESTSTPKSTICAKTIRSRCR